MKQGKQVLLKYKYYTIWGLIWQQSGLYSIWEKTYLETCNHRNVLTFKNLFPPQCSICSGFRYCFWNAQSVPDTFCMWSQSVLWKQSFNICAVWRLIHARQNGYICHKCKLWLTIELETLLTDSMNTSLVSRFYRTIKEGQANLIDERWKSDAKIISAKEWSQAMQNV